MKGGGEHPSPRTMRDLKRMDVLPDGDWLHREFAIVPLYHTEYEGTNTQPETAMGQRYGSDTNSYHENDFRMVHDI